MAIARSIPMTNLRVSILLFSTDYWLLTTSQSPAIQQPRPQKIIQLVDRFHLLHRRVHVVHDADKLDVRIRHHHKAAPQIPIAWLPDAADVDDGSFIR